MAELPRGRRPTRAELSKFREQLAREYTEGASIRELMKRHDRSYGFIHHHLAAARVQFRSQGGSNPRNRA